MNGGDDRGGLGKTGTFWPRYCQNRKKGKDECLYVYD